MKIKLLLLLFLINTLVFSSTVDLTQKEKEFLKQNPTITLGTDSNWAPYIIKNDDNSMDGYDADILKEVNKNTGANFKLVSGEWKNIIQDAKTRKIDGLSTSAVHKEREKYFNFSDIYVSTQRLLIVSNLNPKNINSTNDLKGKRIGYQKSNLFEKKLVERYKDSIGVALKSYGEIIDALIKGEIDAIIGSEAIIYFAQKNGLPYIKTIDSIPNSTLNLVFSIRNDFPEALSILNKGLKSISHNQKLKIQNKWFFNSITNKLNTKSQGIKKGTKNLSELLNDEEKKYLKDNPVLVVQGVATFPPFNFYENGKTMGYSIDYMNLIGSYLGVQVSFVGGKSFPETMSMFRNKQIDILPHIAKNADREKYIEYTDFNHLKYLIGVTLKKDLDIKSFEQLKDKTIAVLDKAFISTYIRKHYPNQKLVIVKSTNDGVVAVSNSKADAFIGSIPTMNFYIKKNWLNNIYTKQIDDIGLPTSVLLPMGVQKGNLVLKSILEKVNKEIDYAEVIKLQEKWLNRTAKDSIVLNLSTEEKKYLQQKDKIKICVLPNWLPFEQIDENGKHKGIGHDILNIISSKIDKEFELVHTKEWAQSLQNIGDRKCDILPVAMDVPSRRDTMNFTKPYVAEPFVIATTSDKFFVRDEQDLSNKKVGIVKSYAYIEVLRRKNPSIDIVEVKDTKEGLERVNNGELFGYIDTMPTIGYFIQKYGYYNLKIAGKLPFDIKLSIASRNDEPILNSIMQKSLNNISNDEIRKIVGKWVEIKVQEEFDYTKLIYVVLFFTIIILLVMYRNKKVNEQRKEFETIFNYSKDGIAITDLDSNFLDSNDSYLNMTSFTKDELLKKSCIGMSTPESKKETKKVFEKVINKGFIDNYEFITIGKNDKRITVSMTANMLPDKKRILLNIKDITQLKLLEDQTRLASMGEMIGNIAHQWRQPLSVITTSASGLKFKYEFTGSIDKENLIFSTDKIVEQAKYLSKTIDDFKNFIKEDKEFKNLSVKETIIGAVSLIDARMKNNFIETIVEFKDDTEIFGNKNELQQAILNILNNSIDFINENVKEEEHKLIFISAAKTEDNKLRLDILDTAGGIEKDIIKKIFDPYFTTKHQSVGTGLGLSMSDKIIRERHGFYMTVNNEEFEHNGFKLKGVKFSIFFGGEN